MVYLVVLGSLSVLFAAVKAYCDVKSLAKREFVFKLLASLCFIACGLTAVALNPDALVFGLFVTAAFVLGLTGDILLCLDAFFPDNPDFEWFFDVTGAATFFAGHIIYAVALFVCAPISAAPASLIAMPVLPLLGGALVLSKKVSLSKSKIAMMTAYLLVLGATISGGAAFFASKGGAAGATVLAASLLFAFSDSLLILRKLCPSVPINPKIAPFIIMPTYCAAQVLYAVAIFLI